MPTKPTLNSRIEYLSAPPIPEVQELASAYDESYGPLIDLSQAVPGYPAPEELTSALAEAASRSDLLGYGRIEGEAELRLAYSDHVSDLHDAQIAASNTHITSGCNQAFIASVMAVAEAGDTVLMTNPCYFNHETTLSMLGIQSAFVDCEPGNAFLPNIDQIRTAVAGKKAFALVSPNNPTGTVYPASLLDEIFEACMAAGCWLIIDETYRDFMDPELRHKLFQNPNWTAGLIQLYSFSKSFCIPGHRLGAVVAGHQVVDAISKIMDNIQICAPRAAQVAVASTMETLSAWRDGNQQEIARRADALRKAFASMPKWHISAIGAYFAYVKHPFPEHSSNAVARSLARNVGVSCVPGDYFGSGQETYLRLAFANADVETIESIPQRLNAFAL